MTASQRILAGLPLSVSLSRWSAECTHACKRQIDARKSTKTVFQPLASEKMMLQNMLASVRSVDTPPRARAHSLKPNQLRPRSRRAAREHRLKTPSGSERVLPSVVLAAASRLFSFTKFPQQTLIRCAALVFAKLRTVLAKIQPAGEPGRRR